MIFIEMVKTNILDIDIIRKESSIMFQYINGDLDLKSPTKN